jgi:glycosyltransferase involved in cell wall biosynthesis
MKIIYIAAGSGGTYCEVCKRDIALARALMDSGHEVMVFPLYTPLATEDPSPAREEVFYGGINAWLQQNVPLFRRTPRFIDWLFDRPSLLRLVSRFAIETDPSELGEMTVSVLRGADGHQRKELDRLMSFLEAVESPDVLTLTNSLLAMIAPEAKRRLGTPVVCALEGEEEFVEQLQSPWRQEAQNLMRRYAQDIDLFTAPDGDYADRMSEFLAVDRRRVRVVPPGIDPGSYRRVDARVSRPFRIGYCGPINRAKGIDLVCAAFESLCEGENAEEGRSELWVGVPTRGENHVLWKELSSRLADKGLEGRVEYAEDLGREERIDFLHRCSVVALPSRCEERTALSCLESLACGVPVVGTDKGVLGEIITRTGGGILTRPSDPEALAGALLEMRANPEEADRMGRRGAEGVERDFCGQAMAKAMMRIYEEVREAKE